LAELSVDGRAMVKWIFMKYNWDVAWIDLDQEREKT
jgi:hypothetical protein